MDPIDNAALEAITTAIRSWTSSSNLLCMAIAIVVLRMESTRRAPQPIAGNRSGGVAMGCVKFLKQYAPEAAGVGACLCLALALRIRGQYGVASENNEVEAVAAIIREWPILLTADTLLALQAMLRVVVLVSSVLRAGAGPTLISQEAAAIAFGAAVGRTALAARSQHYLLDGPLGGNLPVACEILAVPLLAILCRGIHRRALMASVSTLAAAAWIASRNRLSLADDDVADALFIFAHTAELLAAFAYMSRALFSSDVGLGGAGSRRNVALHFAHVIMPFQQCLAAYYFNTAFDFTPSLVGAGHPFPILQIGCAAQFGAYVGAAVLHLAEFLESPVDEPAPLGQEVPIEAPYEWQSAAVVPRHAGVAVAVPRAVF